MRPYIERQDAGVVIIIVGIALAVVVSIAAFVLDIGNAYYRRSILQIASDAASLAAVRKLPSTSDVIAEAQFIAARNGMPASDIAAIECGFWDAAAGSFDVRGCNATGVNAVRVNGARNQATLFAGVLGVDSLFPHAAAIALAGSGSEKCMRPFGVALHILDDLEVGDTFTVSSDAPGNWGKLDIDGNMSSFPEFRDHMINGTECGVVTVGSTVSQGTGDAGVEQVFDIMPEEKKVGMIIGVVNGFSNGNSDAELLEFITVDFVKQENKGKNWVGWFVLRERNTIPPSRSTGGGQPLIVY